MITTYKAVLNKLENKGIELFSLVDDPAMRGTYVAFKDQKPSNLVQFQAIDGEERKVIGLVLQPDFPVYRRDPESGHEYNIVFDSQVIEDLMIEYARQGNQNNASSEHETKVEGITFYEHWQVLDPEKDKSIAFNLNAPKGSWIAMGKADSDEAWNNIKDKKGFSIEGMIGLIELSEEEKLKFKNEDMSNVVLDAITKGFEEVKTMFAATTEETTEEVVETEVKLGSLKSGDLVIEFDGEMLAVGGGVWVTPEGGEKVALPVGEYPIDEKGEVLVVTEEGVVGEIKGVAEVEPEMEAAPAPAVAAPSNDELTQAIKSLLIKYTEDMDARYEAKFTALEKTNTESKRRFS